MRAFRRWRWHLDEMYVKLNGRHCQNNRTDAESRLLRIRPAGSECADVCLPNGRQTGQDFVADTFGAVALATP